MTADMEITAAAMEKATAAIKEGAAPWRSMMWSAAIFTRFMKMW